MPRDWHIFVQVILYLYLLKLSYYHQESMNVGQIDCFTSEHFFRTLCRHETFSAPARHSFTSFKKPTGLWARLVWWAFVCFAVINFYVLQLFFLILLPSLELCSDHIRGKPRFMLLGDDMFYTDYQPTRLTGFETVEMILLNPCKEISLFVFASLCLISNTESVHAITLSFYIRNDASRHDHMQTDWSNVESTQFTLKGIFVLWR